MQKEFETFNPLVIFIYFAMVIGTGVSMSSPFIMAVFTVCGWIYAIYLKGARAIKSNLLMTVPVVLFITIFNTLFTHQGNAILFYINNNPITKEAITFGIFSGFMFASVLIWFSCFNRIVNGEMIMYLFSRISSFFGLLISMILRYIPLLKKRYIDISAGQWCMYQGQEQKGFVRLKTGLKKVSILTSWSLESSIESADSMAARGYGLKGRTSFVLYKMSLRDILMIGLVIFCGAVSIYFAITGKNEMIFYPDVKMPKLTLKGVLSGAWFLVLTLMPVITDIAGEIKWRKSESGI